MTGDDAPRRLLNGGYQLRQILIHVRDPLELDLVRAELYTEELRTSMLWMMRRKCVCFGCDGNVEVRVVTANSWPAWCRLDRPIAIKTPPPVEQNRARSSMIELNRNI